MNNIKAFLPMIAVLVVFYLLIFIPEKKRKKQYNGMLDSLSVNDEIMTKGGIIGKIINIQDDYFILESGPDRARIKMNRQSVSVVSKKANEPVEIKE